MAEDARTGEPEDADQPTQEHPAVRGGAREDPAEPFDPTLAPPSDPYVDDTNIFPAATYPAADDDFDPEDPSIAGASTWSGRAGVPEPGTRPAAPGEQDWESVQQQRGSAWYLPIVLGIILFLLVGLLGVGLWLAFSDNGKPPTTTVTTPAVPATSASASATPSPTTSPSPSVSASTIAVPVVTKISYDAAVGILNSKGLVPVRVAMVSSEFPPGTVLKCEPAEGTVVPIGSSVTLYVAVAPSPSPSPSPSSASPSPSS